MPKLPSPVLPPAPEYMNPTEAFSEFKALAESWFDRGLDQTSYLWLLCWALAWAAASEDDPAHRMAWLHEQLDAAASSPMLQCISRVQKMRNL
jgi:hypothetical protein